MGFKLLSLILLVPSLAWSAGNTNSQSQYFDNLNSGGLFYYNSSGSVTVPNGTDTLCGIADTQTLTNKTFDCTLNTCTNFPGGGVPGGSNTQVQYNNSGAFGGNSSFTYNGSGTVTATTFVGALTGNASTVTTNANLTGPITSSGNTTSIASQTGTGTKFVVDTGPTVSNPTFTGLTTSSRETSTSYEGGNNFLLNPNFQSSTASTSWTVTTGTAGTDTTLKYGNYPQSLKINTTSSIFTLSQSVTPTGSVQNTNTEATIFVNSNATGLKVCDLIGGNQDACSPTFNGTGFWQPVTVNFNGPSSGTTVGILLESLTSQTAQTNTILGYVGPARNIGPVQQAIWIGSLNFNCSGQWSGPTTANTWSDMGSNGGTCTITPAGSLTASGTTAAASLSNAGPGVYQIVATSDYRKAGNANGLVAFSLTDGTLRGGQISVGNTVTSQEIDAGSSLSGSFFYASPQSSLTWKIQSNSDGTNVPRVGQGGATIGSTTQAVLLKFDVFYFPTSAQQVLNANTSPANWSGSSTLTGSTISTSDADPGTISGAITTIGTPQNISCVAATSLLGITCTLPTTGKYQINMDGYTYSSASGGGVYNLLTDGSNVAITGETLLSTGTTQPTQMHQAGNYDATSTTVTFKIRGKVTSGTGSYFPTTFSIVSLNTPIAAPVVLNSITTNAPSATRHEHARISCTSGGCSVVDQFNGNWITSVSRSSAGVYAINTTAAGMNSIPGCEVNGAANGGTNNIYPCSPFTPLSSTTIAVNCGLAGVANDENDFNIVCDWPR